MKIWNWVKLHVCTRMSWALITKIEEHFTISLRKETEKCLGLCLDMILL